MKFNTEIFSQFDKKWALLTVGTPDKFNSMTIGWGGLGTIWFKPAVTVYVRASRYTHELMDGNEYFTVSFYPEECRKILALFGSRSGRDIDKMHFDGLTPKKAGETVTFEEAEVTFVCRKLFKEHLSLEKLPADIIKECYAAGDPHDMYIGEVVEII